MYKIEKGIAMAGGSSKTKRGLLTELFKQMEVGDSFVFPLAERNSICTRAAFLGMKYTTRKISDTEARVWRTA